MPVRHEYALDLAGEAGPGPRSRPADLVLRAITPGDQRALAELMLDAYRDTIDYEGEEIEEALAEVDRYFGGAGGNMPLLEHSFALVRGQRLDSACLVKQWGARGCPLVGYVVTAKACKSHGLDGFVLAQSIRALRLAGHSEIRAVITDGNHASETLFRHAGFARVRETA